MVIRNKCFLIAILFLVASTASFEADDDYGLLLQKRYASYNKEKYPDDPYIYLKDERVVELYKDSTFQIREYDLYKVLKEEAKYSLGEMRALYNSAFEDLKISKARTIAPDGTITEATEFRGLDPYSGFPAYSDIKVKVASLPGVVEGCLVETEKIINGARKLIPGQYWDTWYFQIDVPVLECNYQISVPFDKELQIAEHRLDFKHTVETTEDGGCRIYRWSRKDIPKIEWEEMMPHFSEATSYFTISTIGDWNEFGRWVWGLFEDKMTPDGAIRAKVLELTKDKKSQLEKAEALVRYIQDNFRYVSLSFGENAYGPHRAADVFDNKYGDCKDQSALLAAMLRVIGVKAALGLIHYENDIILDTKCPSPEYFKHVVLLTELDGKEIWIDPLMIGFRFGDVPLNLYGATIFLFDESKPRFREMPAPRIEDYTSKMLMRVTLKPDGSGEGVVEARPGVAYGASLRLGFKDFTEKDRDELCHSFIASVAAGGEVLDLSYTDPKDYSQPFVLKIRFRAPSFAPRMGDFMILDLAEFESTESFSKPERTSPIASYIPMLETSRYEFVLPEGFEVEYLPEGFSYSSPLSSYSSTYEYRDQTIIVEHTSETKRIRLPASTYKQIRQTFDQLTHEGKKKVVLKKQSKPNE